MPAIHSHVVVLHSDTVDMSVPPAEECQIRQICDGLSALGYTPIPVRFNENPAEMAKILRDLDTRVVFNLVEDITGQMKDLYLVPVLLSGLGIKYTGNTAKACHALADKQKCKSALRAAGIRTPDDFNGQDCAGPFIVKSCFEHGSVGLDAGSVLSDPVMIRDKIHLKTQKHGGTWFAERYIEGREFNISLLSTPDGRMETLPCAEMVFHDFDGKPRIIDYAAKWEENTDAFKNTRGSFTFGPQDEPLLGEIREVCRKCWDIFGLNGYVRVDLRVDAAGKPYVIEVNTNPYLVASGGFIRAAGQAGLSQKDVVERLMASLATPDMGQMTPVGAYILEEV